MEFEYTGVIYIDVDAILEVCREDNLIYPDEIREAVLDEISHMDDVDYYHVEGWMIDKIVAEVKKRVDKELYA